MQIQKREIIMCILFSIITCGIYTIYWVVKLNDEIKTLAGDTEAPSGGMVILFTLITCGIYGIYWLYKMGCKLDELANQRGEVGGSRGVLYLVLGIFSLSIVSYALMQDSVNKMI